ncbi:MAG: hypothetical protein COA99_12510, partial [Moraxellaceae bacterium]
MLLTSTKKLLCHSRYRQRFFLMLMLGVIQSVAQQNVFAELPEGMTVQIEYEVSYATQKSTLKKQGAQKNEVQMELELSRELGEVTSFTAIARLRADSEGMLNQTDVTSKNSGVINDLSTADKYSEVSIREFYLDTEFEVFFDCREIAWESFERSIEQGEDSFNNLMVQVTFCVFLFDFETGF